MGSSASSRAKAQAKAAAAAAAGSEGSAASVCDSTSGSTPAVRAATNAGGDVGGSSESSVAAVDPSASSDSAAAKMSATSDASKFVGGEGSEHLKHVEDSSDDTDTDDTGDLQKDDLHREKTSSEGVEEPMLTKTVTQPILRDVKSENCEGDVPDDPLSTNLDEVSASPYFPSKEVPDYEATGFQQHPCGDTSESYPSEVFQDNLQQQEQSLSSVCKDGICSVGDHRTMAQHQQTGAPSAANNNNNLQQHQPTMISASSYPAGYDQQQHMDPSEGAFPVVLEGRRPLDQKQQLSPVALEGSVPSGMEGDAKAAGVANRQKFCPDSDVTVCRGARPKVINVGQEGNADKSNDLPHVN